MVLWCSHLVGWTTFPRILRERVGRRAEGIYSHSVAHTYFITDVLIHLWYETALGPDKCVQTHDKRLQLPQDTLMTKGRGNQNNQVSGHHSSCLQVLSLCLWDSSLLVISFWRLPYRLQDPALGVQTVLQGLLYQPLQLYKPILFNESIEWWYVDDKWMDGWTDG